MTYKINFVFYGRVSTFQILFPFLISYEKQNFYLGWQCAHLNTTLEHPLKIAQAKMLQVEVVGEDSKQSLGLFSFLVFCIHLGWNFKRILWF